jgi:hypothetical protein
MAEMHFQALLQREAVLARRTLALTDAELRISSKPNYSSAQPLLWLFGQECGSMLGGRYALWQVVLGGALPRSRRKNAG